MDHIRLLTARRVYEFPPDVIRLSLISVPNVMQRIRQIFNFQVAQTANQAIGAEGPITPVVLFDNGSLAEDDRSITAIRHLLIEPRRLTVEVGGSSQGAANVYHHLQTEFATVRGPDGVAAIVGEAIGELDFTTLVARCDFGLDMLIAPALRRLYRKTWSLGQRSDSVLNPSLTMRKQAMAAEFPGATPGDTGLFQLELRAGTRMADRTYFSAAPLPTEAHIAYLGELESALGHRK